MTYTNFHTEGVILMAIYLDGKTLYLSDRYIQIYYDVGVNYEHEGLVADWGGIDSVSGSGGVSEISDCNIALLNKKLMYMDTDTRISEIFDNYVLEVRKVEFRQYYPGCTFSSADIFYTGKIDSISFDANLIYLGIKDDEEVFKDVPVGRVSKQEYAYCPTDAIGLAKPIVFGKPPVLPYIDFRPKHVVPAVCVNEYTNQYIIADHKIAQDNIPDIAGTFGMMVMYIEEADSYLIGYPLTSSSYSNTDAGAIITLENDSQWIFYARPKIKGAHYSSITTNHSAAVDESLTSSMSLLAAETFYVMFGGLPDLGFIGPSDAFFTINISGASGSSPYGTMKYYNPDWNAGAGDYSTGVDITAVDVAAGFKTYTFNADNSRHGQDAGGADATNAWTWDEISKYEFGFTVGAGDSITIKDCFMQVQGLQLLSKRRIRSTKKISRRNLKSRRW